MPKIVDHEVRRQEIIHATMRVIQRVGVEKTTVRTIAKETGYSAGVLAHYFKNKEEILAMTHLAAFRQVQIRTNEIIDSAVESEESIEVIRIALYEALPLDELRILEAHVDVSFWPQAILTPSLREIRTKSYLQRHEEWRQRFKKLREAGVIRCKETDVDLADEARMIIDSLSVQALLHPKHITPDKQKHIAENFLSRIQRDG
ncbi:TetR/AcrR family transcriptional regulator [Nesterenkonia ebinurensis]|uniref:TetR/AcrR family transcriptional regulator n=1 Tax=Nesterenkonia ebinurensis TaxID=2608252 RepID=UPI00168B87D2|nr:TetR/AcrR family transcriptional regulator [Nesterenkonia ebinurensis]